MRKQAKKTVKTNAFNAKQHALRLERWIKSQVQKAGAKGVIVGLSGGIDSAVVACICQRAFNEQHLVVPMHIDNSPLDEACTTALIDQFKFHTTTLALKPAVEAVAQTCGIKATDDRVIYGNIKARLRTVSLYALGQKHHYLVCGTSNYVEWQTGYFTKYGDAACDLAPLRNYLKREVYALARYYGVPDIVLNRAPSAALQPNQTDEGDLGITYAAFDAYFANEKNFTGTELKRAQHLYVISQHKRCLPPAPKAYHHRRTLKHI